MMTITNILIGITLAWSLLAFNNEELMRKCILNPYMVHHRKQWWRMLSSGFIHADFLHLLFNLLAFYSFGMAVEAYYTVIFEEKGAFFYLLLYLGGIFIANAPSLAKHRDNHYYNSLGASGAVSAIIFSAILFNPWGNIYLFGLIGIPGVVMGPLYLYAEYKMGQQGQSNINHDAHLWGALFGLVFTIGLNPKILLYFFDKITGAI